MFHIVLVHPEIPPNTGNVIRLAANTGCELHLIEPLGFSMEDKLLQRAGLDYHEYASVRATPTGRLPGEPSAARPGRLFAFTTRGSRPSPPGGLAGRRLARVRRRERGLPPALRDSLCRRRSACACRCAPASAA
jgi:tRNA (cytidine/uridine-2'-O-)-methyltransferase